MYAKWERTSNGEIKEICDLVNPKIGIITAIGPQHLESFKSIDNIIKAKFELLTATDYKNNVADFHYNLAYVYKKLNKEKQAKTYMEYYNKLIDNQWGTNV